MASLVSGEPLRVLLVSPHAKQREEVGEALQGAGEHRFFWVSQPDLALTRAQGLAPHLVLLDDDLTGAGADSAADPAQVATLVRRLVEGLPDSAVLLLASPGALAVAQAAVLAGARAFIPKPVKGEELINVLRQVLSRRVALPPAAAREAPTGRVVVFCAPKGGTGRTTLSINTAVALREVSREPVVIIDADYAAPAIDVALNLRGQRDIRDLLPKLNQLDSDLMSSVLATHSSGVRVLLAPPPDALEYPPTLPQVQQVTAWLKRSFPWVFVDLGLPLDEAAYAFLDAADRVIMSVLPEMVGMRNAKVMLAQFDKRNYPPGKVWPLLNRDGLPGGIKKPDAQAYLGRELTFAVPNDQELATETINRGVPMVISHRRRPVAQAYRRLASRLVDERKEGAVAAAPTAAFAAAALADSGGAPGIRPAPQPAIAAAGAAGAASRMTAAPNAAAPAPRPGAGGPADARGRQPAPKERAPAGPRRQATRLALAAVAVVLIALVIALLAGPVVLRALGGSGQAPPAESQGLAPAEPVTGTPLTALVDPTAAATRSIAQTRTAETLARLLEGSSAPRDDWPPGEGQAVTPLPPTSSPTESPTASPTASPTPTSTRTPAPTATPTATLTDTPTAPPTFTPTPPATATPPPTATATRTRVPTRRPPTFTPRPAATATAASLPSSASPPALTSPAYNQAVSDVVTFVWLPTGPLPVGAKYEVVWWNIDEAPDAARGVAPPTSSTSLAADLAPLYNTGQFRNSQIFWSVIVVQEAPYTRLVSPADAERSALYYSPPGGAPASP